MSPASAARATEAQQVLDGISRAYSKVSTYVGTFDLLQTGKSQAGKSASYVIRQQVAYQAPNRFKVDLSVLSSSVPGLVVGARHTLFSDGRQVTIYDGKANAYRNQPAPPQLAFPALLSSLRLGIIPSRQTKGVKLLPDTRVGGTAVFVLRLQPPVPPKAPPQLKQILAAPVDFAVEKANYHIARITRVTPAGRTVVTVTGQRLNAPLPAGALQFTLPRGAKVAPAAPRPGAPGIPGSGGHR